MKVSRGTKMNGKNIYFNCRSLFWGIGLTVILRMTGTGFWVSCLIGMIIGIIILSLVKNTNNSKFIQSIIGFMMAFYAAVILVNMGGTMYLKNTPIFVLAIPPVITAYLISINRKEPLKKTLSILFYGAFFLCALGSLILLKDVNMENLYPIFYYNLKDILLGAIVFALFSVTPVISLNDTMSKKTLVANYIFSSITIMVVAFLAVTVLGSKEAMLYRYPEYVVLKHIQISEFFSNVDNIFIISMVIDLLVTIAAGLKKIDIGGKPVKYISLVLLVLLVNLFASKSSMVTSLLITTPFVLAFLLFLTLIPKNIMNKNK